jgi:hypothetical protein
MLSFQSALMLSGLFSTGGICTCVAHFYHRTTSPNRRRISDGKQMRLRSRRRRDWDQRRRSALCADHLTAVADITEHAI